MPEIRLQQNELEFTNDHLAFWKGKPFTGVIYDLHKNGKTWSEMSYVNGYQEGLTREWSESGNLLTTENWRSGYLHGIKQEWFIHGSQKRKAIYEFGILVNNKEWDDSGSLVQNFKISQKDLSYSLLITIRKEHNEKLK